MGTYSLQRAGEKLHVTPKVFDLLRHLIERRGQLVTKEELLETLWADSRVNEGAVPWAVSHARSALGQEGKAKHPIETVYGRGYRFVAPVEELAASSAPGPRPAVADAPARQAWPEPPFVGRTRTMAALDARLSAAERGAGSVCSLWGEAGIGKTRCMEELAALASARGFHVWSGRCTEDTVAPPFWPWTQVMKAVARDRPELAGRAQALCARLDAGDDAEDTPDPAEGAAGGTFWFFDGVAELLREASHGSPALLLLDDLHWADAGSIHLLSFLAPELSQHPLLVVTAQRDGGTPRRRELRRLSRHAERVELEPLKPEEVGEYLLAMATRQRPDRELSEALHRVTAGNPLYLLQTVRGLVARHGAQALATLDPAAITPVESAGDVLRAALGALDEQPHRVLELASVLGEELDVASLEAVCELGAEEVLAALEAAAAEGFVVFDPPGRYRFRHGLLRSTLYDGLGALDRARAHRRAAEALERAGGAGARVGEIAQHRYRALALGDHGRVVAAATLAGQAAARLQAFSDAARFYGWAVEAQDLDRDATPRARAELLLRLSQQQALSRHRDAAQQTIARLEEIARPRGYWDLLVRAARVLRPTHLMGSYDDPKACAILEQALAEAPQSETRVHVSALSQLSWIPPHALDMTRSKELALRALSLARELGDDAALFEALHAQLYALSGPDDIDALLSTADELRRRDRSPPTWVTMEALTASHGALLYRGDMAGVDAVLGTLGRIAREQKWAEATWGHARMLAQRRLMQGEFAAAQHSLVELRASAGRLRLGYGAGLIDMMLAQLAVKRDGSAALASLDTATLWSSIHDIMGSMRPTLARLARDAGEAGTAQSVLERMVGEHGTELPKEIGYLNAVANLAQLATDLHDAERAAALYEELSPYPHHNTPTCLMSYEGSVSHYLATVAAFLKRPDAARHFDDALSMNEQLGVRPQLALTRYEYARFLLAATGDRARAGVARELQQRAVELADELGMAWLSTRARTLA